MSPEISERSFEDAIEQALLEYGPDAAASANNMVREASPPYGEMPPGGYHKRRSEDYDRALCLVPRDALDFVLATQPREWLKLKEHHGAAVSEQFLKRLASEIERRGALDVLRHGLKDSGCKFRLAYFRPASGLNEETQRLHAANIFGVLRQFRYSEKNENCLDLGLFLNGIPIFTAELKNPLTGQDVQDAIRQYENDRDPREPLFNYGRCLAHFAVDPDLVYVTTHAVLKTIAAFLNTEGGDLLIGVADDGAIVGTERDQLESDDKFMRHLAQVVRNGLGDRAGTCIDPTMQIVQGKTVCVVSCQRSPEPVFLKWKAMETSPDGDFFVRSGPGSVKLPPDSAREYIRTRFGQFKEES